MSDNLVAEIISVGTELLLGEIVDTNATFLSTRLRDLGITVYRKSTVGDNLERLTETIKNALSRSDIAILGGGLGPTDDDMTREAIAAYVGEEPYVDEQLFKELKEKFAARKRPMPSNNAKQAWLIKSAETLPNPIGTAPGWFVKTNDKKIIITLPGPPHEMTRMWIEEVEPKLPVSSKCLYHKIIRTIGLGESFLTEKIAKYTNLAVPGVGTYCRDSGVDIRVAAVGDTIEEAEKIVTPVVEDICSILSGYVFGFDDDSIVSVIKKRLDEKNQTISCIESLTGGMLASQIAACEGISSCFKGSITSYTNEIKEFAGVNHETIEKYGAVSKETAIEMAQSVKKLFKTDWAISTTGVAGPGSLEGKRPGTAWVAVAGPNVVVTDFVDWPGSREMVRQRVCKTALNLIFKQL
ncbi:MAG: competence/damage-inducible protein A [Candidatus Riflebacteria bacterium]|nr:competence/damage-inducible protein A [Candidatus Riflebacteria bacterium]